MEAWYLVTDLFVCVDLMNVKGTGYDEYVFVTEVT